MRAYGVTYTAFVPRLLREYAARLRASRSSVPDFERRVHELRDQPVRPGQRPEWLEELLTPHFGRNLRLILVGGAFIEPSLASFFADIGVRVGAGYGLTEAGAVVAVSDPGAASFDGTYVLLPGVEAEVRDADGDGFGEVWIQTPTQMRGYHQAPNLTSETLVDGWLRTGDVGRLRDRRRLTLVGRATNMIVTEGGKNVYPEDVEVELADRLRDLEWCVLAENYVWPERTMVGERLIVVLRRDGTRATAEALEALAEANRSLGAHKRLHGYVLWDRVFPRTGSLKVRRDLLAAEVRGAGPRSLVRGFGELSSTSVGPPTCTRARKG